MRRAMALVFLAFLAPLAVAQAEEGPRLVRVTPIRVGDLVACRLQTMGLPGEKPLQSMRSGLVSAVELNLALVDENDRLVAGRSLTFRLGFDLWEEFFSVRENGRDSRFQSLNDLQAYLADLGHLAMVPVSALTPGSRYRLRVGLMVHPIAPDEQKRVEDVIVGDQRLRREGQDQQEASVSLGRLIRLFYKGGGDDRDGQELMSGWFRREELPDETH